MRPAEVDLASVVQEVTDRFELELASAHCPLTVACGGPVVVFERFERAAPWKHYGGLGLGLHIAVRHIVLARGGRMRVECRPGEGATFIVELPCVPPAMQIGPRAG